MSLSSPAAAFLDASIRAGLNILVSGGTQAGKTTFLNCLAASIPGGDRVVSAEEVFELQFSHPDWVPMQTRQAGLEGTGEIALRDLVKEALRMRPSRVIVGEVLGVMRSLAEDEGRQRTYTITGQVFFATADRFVNAFDFQEVIERVRIDVGRAHFWDITAVSALDKVVLKFRREGCEVEIIGLNEASATMVDKFGVHDKDGADDLLLGH